MINQSTPKTNKKPITFIMVGLGLLIIGIAVAILLHKWVFSPESTSPEQNEQNTDIIISENLEYVLKKYLDNYTINYTEEALRDYFPSIYSTGTLINFVSFNTTHEVYSIKIIDSHGMFHILTVQENGDKVKVAIDEYEKSYEIDNIKHEDEG